MLNICEYAFQYFFYHLVWYTTLILKTTFEIAAQVIQSERSGWKKNLDYFCSQSYHTIQFIWFMNREEKKWGDLSSFLLSFFAIFQTLSVVLCNFNTRRTWILAYSATTYPYWGHLNKIGQSDYRTRTTNFNQSQLNQSRVNRNKN